MRREEKIRSNSEKNFVFFFFFFCRLRDLSLSKQAENETLKKQNETLEHRLKLIHKENDHLKTDMTTMQSTITDLKEQVDRFADVFLSFCYD